jgi:hypothetical protein
MVIGLEIHMQVCEAEIRDDQQLPAICIPHMLCMTSCFVGRHWYCIVRVC